MTLEREPIAPGAFVAELVHEWAHRFSQEGAVVDVRSSRDDAPTFSGDKPLLKRVFSNLMQNALTHSGKSITLRISVRGEDGGVLFGVRRQRRRESPRSFTS